MSKNRYRIIRGLHGEIEDIIDRCKQGKHLSFSDFMIQINEQDKAYKKLNDDIVELKKKNLTLWDKIRLKLGDNGVLK